MKLKENLTDDFKQKVGSYIMGQKEISSNPEGSITGFQTINKLKSTTLISPLYHMRFPYSGPSGFVSFQFLLLIVSSL